jgi:DNA-binding transcriptional regulator YiaG
LRARLGLSQEKFARLIGVTFLSVNGWENDRQGPGLKNARLLEALEEAVRTHGAVHDGNMAKYQSCLANLRPR